MNVDCEVVLSNQIANDVVVVTGVEGDVVAAAFGSGADDDRRAVTVERGDFDRASVFDLAKAAPELYWHVDAADGRLEVETEEVYILGDGAAMVEKLRDRRAA